MMDRYFRFIELSASNILPVDLVATKLLEYIAVCEDYEDCATVGDAMRCKELGSPATLHRKLDDLLAAGLVVHEFDGANRRTKYLVLTPKAKDHFAKLGRAIVASGMAVIEGTANPEKADIEVTCTLCEGPVHRIANNLMRIKCGDCGHTWPIEKSEP